MLENVTTFFKKMGKKEQLDKSSKDEAKERLHLVLMQDRANVSADFLEMMKQEIVDVIKKYIDVDENEMNVKLENRLNDDGTSGAPSLYANIPIMAINEEKKKESNELTKAKKAEVESEEEKTKGKKTVTKKAKSTTKKTVSAKKATTKTSKTTKKTTTKKKSEAEETDSDVEKSVKEPKTTKKSTKKVNDDDALKIEENVAKTKKVSTKKTTTTEK